MTRIVKAVAVVDAVREPGQAQVFPVVPSTSVIKRGVMRNGMPHTAQPARTQQSYVDELNRVRVEITQAKAELRVLTRALEDTQKEFEEIRDLLDGNAGDANSKLNEIKQRLDETKKEAEVIITEAQSEAQQICEQAQNDGYLEGFSKGFEEARTEYQNQNQPLAHQLEDMIEHITLYEKQQIEENEANIVDLAITISSRILGRELSAGPEAVTSMLYQVIDQNKREDFIKITLAPDLMPVKAKSGEAVKTMLMEMGANITVLTDNELEAGSAIIETPKGFTDVSVSTQLNNIQDLLTQE